MAFKHATKKQAKLRLAVLGPSGSGKTYSALSIAAPLAASNGGNGKIAVVDTEHGSASKYADRFVFDVSELTNYHPSGYVDAIHEAEKLGYDVVILDSLSHAWTGTGGVLDVVGGNFNNWRTGTPLHNSLIEAILAARIHVIATMRVKTEWVVETVEKNGSKKTEPRKVGTGPVQRDGMDYEFDVVGVLDEAHTMRVDKTRCQAIDGRTFHKPGAEFTQHLIDWLSDGVANPELEKAVAAGMDLIADRTKTIDDVGAALKAHVAGLPDALRDEARARLGVQFRVREAADRAEGKA